MDTNINTNINAKQTSWSWRDCCMTFKVLVALGLLLGARWLFTLLFA